MKIYVVTIKESGKLASYYQAWKKFPDAVSFIKKTCLEFNFDYRETELKNEFRIYRNSGEYLHTLRIVDLNVY